MYVKYAVGGFTVGYKYLKLIMTLLASSQESIAYGITYAVNDDLSIGYSYTYLEFDSGAKMMQIKSQLVFLLHTLWVE